MCDAQVYDLPVGVAILGTFSDFCTQKCGQQDSVATRPTITHMKWQETRVPLAWHCWVKSIRLVFNLSCCRAKAGVWSSTVELRFIPALNMRGLHSAKHRSFGSRKVRMVQRTDAMVGGRLHTVSKGKIIVGMPTVGLGRSQSSAIVPLHALFICIHPLVFGTQWLFSIPLERNAQRKKNAPQQPLS